jgi:hypothetical protein
LRKGSYLQISKLEDCLKGFYESRYCVKSPVTLIVIPGLTPNPVSLNWIPAFAGMAASELM